MDSTPLAAAPQLTDARPVDCQPLTTERLDRAKCSYAMRRIHSADMATLLSGDEITPRAGDLVLARIDRLRQHCRIELPNGRRAHLFANDEVLLCYGARYAPDQFEAVVPDDLGPCHMAAAGGIAARVISRSGQVKPATEITPIGLVGDAVGRRLNLSNYALSPPKLVARPPLCVGVVGTSMNSGKTSTVAALVRGMSAAGMKVGAAKVTGTGAGGDHWKMIDSGAAMVLDFTDVGYASTYKVDEDAVETILARLVAHLTAARVDAIVLEVADGLFQRETASLIKSRAYASRVDTTVFAAGEALGAVAGWQRLRSGDLPVAAVSGLLTRSPLAIAEARQFISAPVLTLAELRDPDICLPLVDGSRELVAAGQAV